MKSKIDKYACSILLFYILEGLILENYYKLRNFFNKKLYFFKNKHYQRIAKKSLTKKNHNIIIKNFINNIKHSIMIILLLFIIERIIKEIVVKMNWQHVNILKEYLNINQEMFSQFLICGIGVAGVFLALYYSNIATIYSSEYANTINRIRQLFEYEIGQNINLRKINTYIIQATLILFSMMIGLPIWYIFVIYMIIKTIDIIINFIISGNTIYEFANLYNALLNRRKQLIFHIDHVTDKGYLNNNFAFQNYHGKESVKILDDMELVNNYILNEKDLNKKDAILEFISNNINVLNYYLYNKNRILFNSLWYQKKIEHKKWYSADFTEKGIALNTGTELQPRGVADSDWFEKQILIINKKSIGFLINNNCIKEIGDYIKNIIESIPYWVEFGNIDVMYEHIENIIQNIQKIILKEDTNEEVSKILEVICYLFINYVLSIRDFIMKINLDECEKFIKNDYKFDDKNIQKNNKRIFNNPEFYNIFNGLKNEKKIEKKLITPSWYIKQRVSKLYIIEINKLLKIVEKIYEMNYQLCVDFLEKNKYTYSAAFLVNENELFDKINLLAESCLILDDILLSNDIEKDYKLPSIYINKMMEKIKNKHIEQIPELWEKSCEVWGLKNNTNARDVFGFCYNNLCEYIFENIIEFNYDLFATHYEKLVGLAILSEINIHDELINNELYTDNAKFKFQISGLNTMFELSGHAIIIGEILKDYRWKKTVDDSIDRIFKKFNEAKRWKNIISWLVNDFWNIGNIDSTNREMRFFNAIKKSQKLKFENVGPFGHQKVINTKNLEQIYYDDLKGLSADMREIFAIACLNKYLDSENKYKSDRMRIEEWEEMKDEKE